MAAKQAPRAEKPEAARAFEDYYALGEGRSLARLAAMYRASSNPAPTRHIRTLKDWSARHGWQQRIKDRDAEDAEEVRKALKKRVKAHRERLLGAIEVDSARYIKQLREDPAALMATDAGALEKLTKLYFQLAEEPLTDKHEVEQSGELALSWWDTLDAARARGEEPDGEATDSTDA